MLSSCQGAETPRDRTDPLNLGHWASLASVGLPRTVYLYQDSYLLRESTGLEWIMLSRSPADLQVMWL